VDVPGSDDLEAKGDFTGHEYFLVVVQSPGHRLEADTCGWISPRGKMTF